MTMPDKKDSAPEVQRTVKVLLDVTDAMVHTLDVELGRPDAKSLAAMEALGDNRARRLRQLVREGMEYKRLWDDILKESV